MFVVYSGQKNSIVMLTFKKRFLQIVASHSSNYLLVRALQKNQFGLERFCYFLVDFCNSCIDSFTAWLELCMSYLTL